MDGQNFAAVASRLRFSEKNWTTLRDEMLELLDEDPKVAAVAVQAILDPSVSRGIVDCHEPNQQHFLGQFDHLVRQRLTAFARAIVVATCERKDRSDLTQVLVELGRVEMLANEVMGRIGQMPIATIDSVLVSLDTAMRRDLELGIGIAQERLIRHHDIGEPGRRVSEAARQLGLRASWLPMELHSLESDNRLRLVGADPSAVKEYWQAVAAVSGHEPESTIREVAERHSTAPSVWPPALGVQMTHEPITRASNGQVVAMQFHGDSRYQAEWSSEAIDFLQPATLVEPQRAVFLLLDQYPSVHGQGRPVWLARLRMAETIAAFCNAPVNASFMEAMDLAANHHWYTFKSAATWAHDRGARELGLACFASGWGVALVTTDSS